MTDRTEAGLDLERLAKMCDELADGFEDDSQMWRLVDPWTDNRAPRYADRAEKRAADWRTIASIIRESPDRAAVGEPVAFMVDEPGEPTWFTKHEPDTHKPLHPMTQIVKLYRGTQP